MPVPSDDKLIDLLIGVRDEHVRRLHAVHLQVGVLVLTVSVAVFIGAILGIDALADVDVTLEAAGRLLAIGKWAFAGSAALIALAAIQHTRDRRVAASHLGSAVARLIAGEERELVLADLRKGPYLSTEANDRWLGLSLHEKIFAGCALLLVASLAIGLGIVAGYAPNSADEGADADFASALHEATQNVKTPEGAKYDQLFGESFANRFKESVAPCMRGLGPSEIGTVEIVARVGDGGRLQKVLVEPSTKFAECVREAIANDEYPAPPEPRYWVNVHMSLRE